MGRAKRSRIVFPEQGAGQNCSTWNNFLVLTPTELDGRERPGSDSGQDWQIAQPDPESWQCVRAWIEIRFLVRKIVPRGTIFRTAGI